MAHPFRQPDGAPPLYLTEFQQAAAAFAALYQIIGPPNTPAIRTAQHAALAHLRALLDLIEPTLPLPPRERD